MTKRDVINEIFDHVKKQSYPISLVSGQLKSSIDAHGPITYEKIPSASKRVWCETWGLIKQKVLQDLQELDRKMEG